MSVTSRPRSISRRRGDALRPALMSSAKHFATRTDAHDQFRVNGLADWTTCIPEIGQKITLSRTGPEWDLLPRH